jgi:hypothetical protein
MNNYCGSGLGVRCTFIKKSLKILLEGKASCRIHKKLPKWSLATGQISPEPFFGRGGGVWL